MKWKFSNGHSFNQMHKLEHRGQVGHRSGQNITVHVVSMLDDSSRYKVVNGKWFVRDIDKHHNGRYKVEKNYIPLEEHNRRSYPQIKNPF
jgi:hypothetical protein